MSPRRGVAVLFGLLINTVWIDPLSGVSRFTFGTEPFYDGFSLIPTLIELFALSVVFSAFEEGKLCYRVIEKVTGKFFAITKNLKFKYTILRSSLLNTIFGIYPGQAQR